MEWVNGDFARRPHNPAFEVVYVYNRNAGTLDLNFRGSPKAIEPLQGMVAEAILKLKEMRLSSRIKPGDRMRQGSSAAGLLQRDAIGDRTTRVHFDIDKPAKIGGNFGATQLTVLYLPFYYESLQTVFSSVSATSQYSNFHPSKKSLPLSRPVSD